MSDENSNGAASSSEPMIPKSRMDELIAERNSERQERMFLQQQLADVAKSRQVAQGPEREDPEMEELKSRDPVTYKRLKKQEFEMRQLRAGFSSVMDNNDRLAFLHESGDAGKKKLAEVEKILQHERQNNNFKVNRIGIYNWLKGNEAIQKEREVQAAPRKPAEVTQASDDAPSSDPGFATTISGGSVSGRVVEETRDERFKRLENVVF